MVQSTSNGRQKAFTLVEILIVISIMSLLVTLVLPRYFNSIELSKQQVQIQNIRTIQRSIDYYYQDKGNYPNSLETLVDAGYIKSIPIDPLTERNTSWILEYEIINGTQGVSNVKSSEPISIDKL